jgi:hypothetical protein
MVPPLSRAYWFGGESAGGVAVPSGEVVVLSAGGVVVDESGVAAPVSAGGVVVSAGGGAVDESAGGLADGEADSCFAQADASNRAAILRARRLRFIMDHLTDKRTDALKSRVAFPGQWQDHRAPLRSSTPCAHDVSEKL